MNIKYLKMKIQDEKNLELGNLTDIFVK